MERLLTSDDINVPDEETVMTSLLSWVSHDPAVRQRHLPSLLVHVRLPLLQPQVRAAGNSCSQPVYQCVTRTGDKNIRCEAVDDLRLKPILSVLCFVVTHQFFSSAKSQYWKVYLTPPLEKWRPTNPNKQKVLRNSHSEAENWNWKHVLWSNKSFQPLKKHNKTFWVLIFCQDFLDITTIWMFLPLKIWQFRGSNSLHPPLFFYFILFYIIFSI